MNTVPPGGFGLAMAVALALVLVRLSPLPAQYLQTRLIAQPGPFTGIPQDLQAIDLDSDGVLDLVGFDTAVRWIRAPGFASATEIQAAPVLLAATATSGLPAPVRVLAGLVDGDAFPDVIVGDNSGICRLLAGDGSGGFSAPAAIGLLVIPGSGTLRADVDGDGRLDVISWVQNWASQSVNVHLNRHPVWPLPVILTTSNSAGPPVVGDFNGDGCDDVCWVSGFGPGSTAIQYALGSAVGVGPPQTLPATWGVNLRPWTCGDLDRDGRDDLLLQGMAWIFASYVSFGNQSSVLEPATLLGPPPAQSPPVAVPFIADVNADGRPDVLFPSIDVATVSRRFYVVPGLSSRTFGAALTLDWTGPGSWVPDSGVGDFDGDGDPELILCHWTSVVPLENRAIRGVACGSPSGTPRIGLGTAVIGNALFSVGLTFAAPVRPAGLFLSLGLASPAYCGPGLDLSPGMLLLPAGGAGLVTTDTTGAAGVALPIPQVAALAGTTVFARWAVDDPGGGYASGGRNYALTEVRTIVVW